MGFIGGSRAELGQHPEALGRIDEWPAKPSSSIEATGSGF
jgi:hypothetical protein